MISARFRIQLPDDLWVTDLSEAYPGATFRLLSGYRHDTHAIELGETITDRPDDVTTAMREHPSISNFELLESQGRRRLAKYETSDTALYDFVDSASLTIEFPVDVQDGFYEFTLTGTQEEFDHLQVFLEESPLSYELNSLVGSRATDDILTDRQQEVLETAVRCGYFEVPRECTLADLAARLDVDKSTVSAILRRAECRVLEWFVTAPPGHLSG